MKSYRIKSLIFFSCFLAAAIFFYNFEQGKQLQDQTLQASIADAQIEDTAQDMYLEEGDVSKE